jgi:hypothetical protein
MVSKPRRGVTQSVPLVRIQSSPPNCCTFWPRASSSSLSDHRSLHGTTFTLAEPICRVRDRLDSPRVSRLHRNLQRAPSAPRPAIVSTTTTGTGPISHSTRIAQTHARSCQMGADESSPSRKSMACITVTNVSPPEQYHFPFANVAPLLF